jgi:EEF1A N-terminal glycine/lysine methyltransferase
LADHLFSPALVIAERIERCLLSVSDKTVLELGAGAALPSLLSTILPLSDAPKLVVVTDYPDAAIMGNVERNVKENAALANSGVDIRPVGYEWGADPQHLLYVLL